MTKTCDKCKKTSIWTDYTNKKLCETHFLEQIEKRIRKNLRTKKLIDLKKEYTIIKDEENKHIITQHFLKKIFPNRIKLTKNKDAIKINSNTLDDETQELIEKFTKNKEITKEIKPISVITDEELKIIAKILNQKVKIKPKTQDKLTKKDPQLLFSTHKSKEFIEKREKK